MANPSHSFLLLIGDESVLLLPPQHLPDPNPLFAASHDEEDIEALLQVISMAPHLPLIILSDCSAQHYSSETIPPLSASDRKKLLKRRLEEIYPDAAYRAALPQGSEKALMVGVEETGPLAIWQERLDTIPNPTGIVSLLPIESANMLAALWPESKEGWAILLSFHKTGGTRQIVTHNGELVFTRLTTPISEGTSVGYMSATLAIDIKATRDYLLRMGFSNETPFHLIAIMPEKLHAAMEATPLDVSTRHLFTPHEAAIKLDLALAPEKDETISDLIHLLWMSRKTEPKVILAKMSKLSEMFHTKIHKIGMTTAIFFALFAGVFIGQSTLNFLKTQRIVYEVQYDIDQLESTIAKNQHMLTTAVEPLSRLRMAVERKRLFKKDRAIPLKILAAIQNAIGEDMRLSKLNWEDDKLTFTMHITDEYLLKEPMALNKEAIRAVYKIAEKTMREALHRSYPQSELNLKSLSIAEHNKNKTLSSNDAQKPKQPPKALFVIEWKEE